MSVAINGKALISFQVDHRLRQHHSSVQQYLHPLAPEDEFIRGLRADVPHEKHGRPNLDELVAGVTTPFFKNLGISGWQSRPLGEATVIGVLKHSPSPGADGFVSFDLELEQVQARGRSVVLTGQELPRYLRIEYTNATDLRYLKWPVGTRLLVKGDVLWDTDQYGFYEIHPVRDGQIDVPKAETLIGVSDLYTAVKKGGWWIVRFVHPRTASGMREASPPVVGGDDH